MPPPPRVLFLSATGLMGGAERSLYELLNALPQDLVEPHVCMPAEGGLARLCRLAHVHVHPVALRRYRRSLHPLVLAGQAWSLYRGVRAVRHVVRREQIQLLHANTDAAALVAWEVSRELGCPFVWHCRDLNPLGALVKLLTPPRACAVAISEAVARHLRNQGVPAERIRLVRNGIDLSRWRPPEERPAVRARVRAELRIPARAPVLLDIGGWVHWKRHELFLEAVGLVRRQLPEAVGVLVGSDLFQQNAGYAAYLAGQLHLVTEAGGGIIALPQRDDIPDLLAAADILVSPSDREPFGRVLAEAGAAGLPVVATNSGGKAEIVIDGDTGLLTPPGDAVALAQACLRLLGNPDALEQLGACARERVTAHFDVRRVAREMVQLYTDFLARQGEPGK